MKKIIFLITSLFFIFGELEYALASGLVGEDAVLKCVTAAYKSPMDVVSMGNINNPLDPKRIFQCKGATSQDILYQAILDVKFTEIDLKIEKYLESLKGNSKPINVIEDLQKKFGLNGDKGSFYYQYNEACNSGIFSYATDFVKAHSDIVSTLTTNDMTKDYLGGVKCKALFKLKLKSYYDAGEVISVRETINGYEESKHTFMSKIKKQYEALLFKMTIYMGQLGVIKDKWNTNTKDPGN
ncbi:MAG: hypothetical protein PHZ26_01885 [Candidatus Gracilibacteria bacterium]|nr:hypothetical protein [Candidatus Gracilibacteria bacterium]MDD2908485.1 hypothetical protein [Candidatus Gracilibacteria bacterium]